MDGNKQSINANASSILQSIGKEVTEKQWETYKLIKSACGDLVCDALDSQSDSSSDGEDIETSTLEPQPCCSKSINDNNLGSTSQFSNLNINEEHQNLTYRYIDGQLSFDELANLLEKETSEEVDSQKVKAGQSEEAKTVAEEVDDVDVEMDDEDKGIGELVDETDPEWKPEDEFEQLIVSHQFTSSKRRKKAQRSPGGGGGVGFRRSRLPRDLMGLVGEANLCFARGQHEDAIRMCLEVIRLAPTAPEPFQTLGMLYEEMNELEKAFQYHLIAAYLCPSDGDNWIKVAEMAVEQENYQQAITCYSHAIKIFPLNIDLLWQRCKLYEKIKDLKKAMDGYESILKALKPSDGEIGIHLAKDIAKLHFSAGNLSASIQVMETAMEKYPKSITSEDVNLYVELLISEKQFMKSLVALNTYCGVKYIIDNDVVQDLNSIELSDILDKMLVELPSEVFPVDLRAKLIVSLINLRLLNSVSYLCKVITNESAEEMGDLYLDIAEAYLGQELFIEAEPLLAELIYTQSYNIAAVWLRYARCLKKVNKIEEAIAAYYEVVRQAPDHHEARLELTDLLITTGRHEDATAASGQDESSAVSLDLLLLRCKLLYQQELWNDFVVAAKLFLLNDMYYLTHDKEIAMMINSQSHRKRIDNLLQVHKELGINDVRNLKFTGDNVSSDAMIDILYKLCHVLYDKLNNPKELVRVVFSAFTSGLLRDKQDTLDFCALTALYLTRNLNHFYPFLKMVISRNVRNNQVWNLFCVAMMRYYQDLRHNRFCLRLFIKNPDITALAYFNGHNALMSGSYKHALAEYVNIHRNDANDTLAILCIAIGFSHIACQKFITSRHSVVIQLCAFLNMYLQVRGECQESLYNIGRAFHQLGLSNEAVHFYKKALQCVDDIEMSNEDEAKETVDQMHQRIIGEGTSFGYASHPQYQYFQQQQPSSSHHHPFRRAVHFQGNTYHDPSDRGRMPEMVLQSDFRKISGISSEVFRQIEAVEKEFDATTAANFEAVEKRGEMLIRLLDPRQLGRAGAEAGWKYLSSSANGGHSVQFVEIVKRPGQTLGLYIREGDGFRCSDGVFISRIALESPVYNSGLLKVGDEILAVNLVDVRRMSLDDVVIIMSIPRRLVLTIRSRNLRDGMQSMEMMNARRSYGDDYRQPPVVVVKKELTDEDCYLQDDVSSNRESENGHLLQARMKGLPAEIPPVAISLNTTNSMMFGHEQGYYNRPDMRNTRDDTWNPLQQRAIDYRNRPYGVITRQPHSLQRQYPRTIDNLHQYYSGYSSDVPSSRRSAMHVTNASVHRPMLERSSSVRQRIMDEYGTAGVLRRGRLLRTESDNRIHPTASDYFLDQYSRPMSRSNMRSQTPTGYIGLSQMQGMRRRNDDLRQSLSTHGITSLMRRRRFTDGSVSDTEVDSVSSRPLTVRRNVGRYTPRGRPTRDLFQNRSHSLPRTRTEPMTDYRYSKPSPSPFRQRLQQQQQQQQQQRGPQSVRFEKTFGYDEDSDGAVSAPELPDDRRARRLLARRGPSPNDYSSDEYRQWLRRAPSTSAIYETIRRAGGTSSTLPTGLSSTSLYRIAHSAESLLDTIRMEQQKSLLENLYANRIAGKSSPLPSMLTKRDYSNDSLSALKHPRTRSHLRSHSTGLDYLRAIPNPTPVKPSEHERMHLLTLNPREFFKYRYEKPTATQPETSAAEINPTTINENTVVNKPITGFTGILWVHLLAGRGLRSVSLPANNRDLYCVIECDRIHKARTVVRSGESSFDWDEVFELDLFDTKEVSFLLYSWDPQSRHKLCYKGVINLMSLSLTETPVHSLALKMEPKGTIYVKLRYKDPHLAFQRTTVNTSLHSSALFGVDLETVVNRENSGFNVPLIVKRCVEEVERRGLDLVGIYRLCGSAVRKKMLRDSFEKNAWLVDLSAEHVPDINVITSKSL